MNPLTTLLRGLIRIYQWVLAPVLGANCRYAPSCSEYAPVPPATPVKSAGSAPITGH